MDLTTFWWKLFIKNIASQKSQLWDSPRRKDDSLRRTVFQICCEDNGTMKLSLRPLDIIEDHGWKNFASSTKKTMNQKIQTKEFTEEKKAMVKTAKGKKMISMYVISFHLVNNYYSTSLFLTLMKGRTQNFWNHHPKHGTFLFMFTEYFATQCHAAQGYLSLSRFYKLIYPFIFYLSSFLFSE